MPPRNPRPRRALPYRSGMYGHLTPLTPNEMIVWLLARSRRLRLELFMPYDKTRWN